MSSFFRKPVRAFTLVETLVAVAILTIAIVGPYTAAAKSLAAAYVARDELVASGLAQEGVEYARNVRDTNYLAHNPWLTGLSACMPGPCVFDTVTSPSGFVAPLYLRSDTGSYNQRAIGTVTPFTRTISITPVPVGAPNPTEVLVTVTVSWKTTNTPYSVTVDEHLSNWQ